MLLLANYSNCVVGGEVHNKTAVTQSSFTKVRVTACEGLATPREAAASSKHLINLSLAFPSSSLLLSEVDL